MAPNVIHLVKSYVIFLYTSFVPFEGNFGSLYQGKATATARAALPISNSRCSIFLFPNKGMAADAWDL